MKAIKENRVYTITEVDVSTFAKKGYDIYDDKGKLVKYGFGKTVPYDKYDKLLKENEKLKKQIKDLKIKKEEK